MSFFLELESIETRKFKIVKIRGIHPRCRGIHPRSIYIDIDIYIDVDIDIDIDIYIDIDIDVVVVFVSFVLELELIETRKIKTVKIRGSFPKCNEISSSFSSWGEGVTRVPSPPDPKPWGWG